MDKQALIKLCADFSDNSELNYIKKEDALSPELVGVRICEPPVLGFATADDSIFCDYKREGAVGPHYLTPLEWLPGSVTVISFFNHFTREVVESNAADFEKPSMLWLHGYKEGMDYIKAMLRHISAALTADAMETVVPMFDTRFKAVEREGGTNDFPTFSSNWSERHTAYACGLGTFGLSKGLITKNGVAGRFGSVITKGFFEPDNRPYTGLYDYCNNCGTCAAHCPVNAITLEGGKEHEPCSIFLDNMKKLHGARGSCGKCQAGAPCAYRPANS